MEQTGELNSRPTESRPRIYVASLADYTACVLHGRWIEATQSAADMRHQIADMLNDSLSPHAEEWAIHDCEHFGGLVIDEHADLDDVADVAALVVEYGPMIGELVAHLGGITEAAEARRYVEEGYRGSFDDLAHYAREFVEECYGSFVEELPAVISGNIDCDGIAHDMECGGDVFTVAGVNGTVHVFKTNI